MRDIGVTSTMYSTVVMVALTLVAALATALVYGLGGVFVVNGTLAIGTLVALTAYLNRLYGPITALSNVQVDVMTTLVSFERVFEVLDLEPMITRVRRTPGRCPTGRPRSSSTGSRSATPRPPRSRSPRSSRSTPTA